LRPGGVGVEGDRHGGGGIGANQDRAERDRRRPPRAGMAGQREQDDQHGQVDRLRGETAAGKVCPVEVELVTRRAGAGDEQRRQRPAAPDEQPGDEQRAEQPPDRHGLAQQRLGGDRATRRHEHEARDAGDGVDRRHRGGDQADRHRGVKQVHPPSGEETAQVSGVGHGLIVRRRSLGGHRGQVRPDVAASYDPASQRGPL
jgi:hypothetical protein